MPKGRWVDKWKGFARVTLYIIQCPFVVVSHMRKVVAELRSERFREVDLALGAIGVTGITVAEESVAGRGRWTYPAENIHHLILTVLVNDDGVDRVLESICGTASTGSSGDGRVSVSRLESCYDIATGMPETGELEVPLIDA